jgi:hypothetical protein
MAARRMANQRLNGISIGIKVNSVESKEMMSISSRGAPAKDKGS